MLKVMIQTENACCEIADFDLQGDACVNEVLDVVRKAMIGVGYCLSKDLIVVENN